MDKHLFWTFWLIPDLGMVGHGERQSGIHDSARFPLILRLYRARDIQQTILQYHHSNWASKILVVPKLLGTLSAICKRTSSQPKFQSDDGEVKSQCTRNPDRAKNAACSSCEQISLWKGDVDCLWEEIKRKIALCNSYNWFTLKKAKYSLPLIVLYLISFCSMALTRNQC